MAARTSPFLLMGLKGVSSVIIPSTFPYIYTLSKKISLLPVALQALITFVIICGQLFFQTRISYGSPASRYTTEDPLMACNVCSKLVRSAGWVSAPATGFGFLDTNRNFSLFI